jgi:hypothetical protein
MATIDVSGLIAAVDKSVGVKASAVTLINTFAAKVSEAVAAALAADDAADQGSIDAANAAISSEVARLTGSADELAAAIANHSSPPVGPGTP